MSNKTRHEHEHEHHHAHGCGCSCSCHDDDCCGHGHSHGADPDGIKKEIVFIAVSAALTAIALLFLDGTVNMIALLAAYFAAGA